jgi:lipopolysaccharide/colanic/teichoic acid biosynthesis glycosyltransferase
MTIKRGIKHLINHSPATRDADEFFLPKDVFRRIIDRERERANRTGDVFSMVAFVLPGSSEKQEALALLTDLLASRLRSIDAVGWLDSHHIGILLPETDSAGAHMFAKKVFQEKISGQLVPNYEIFTYPSEKLTDPEKRDLFEASVKAEHKKHRSSLWGGWHFPKPQRNVDYMFCLTKRVFKRGFDLVGAGVCLLVLSPLFLVVAVIIKVVSPGPIFYKQLRIGYAGQPFTFLKFRTMSPGADTKEHQEYLATLIKGVPGNDGSDAPMSKLDHDPQIIPCGNLLRKTCLDELPQLINVLRGEMSLVGPRPPIPYEVKEYDSWHRGRFNAIPGMTGLWQVSGKNKLSFREMVRIDIRYARERSLWVDIKILFRTPLAILEQLTDSLKKENSTIKEGV